MVGFIYAPLVALIVWYVAGQYGFNLRYVDVLVCVVVAKVLALYLKNDTDVEITVNTKEAEK